MIKGLKFRAGPFQARRFRRQRGQALLEFALTAAIVIIFLFGILVTGLHIYEWVVATGAAQAGAQAGANQAEAWREQCMQGNTDPSAVRQTAIDATLQELAKDQVSQGTDPQVDVSLPACTPGSAEDVLSGDAVSAERERRITIHVHYQSKFEIPLLNIPFTVEATSSKRLERFYHVSP